ncbi:MAG: prepilin-type N-terminal cleavage/methylation domain-containing protein [Lachnospiraceae bacterium]|nr:prepilin-type N-terminal cleavage/methylation domain-containing protein [Lachnospiraceae bacterium]
MKKTAKIRRNKELNNHTLVSLDKGFTLIEVLVAVIIIAIVSIPVFRAFVTSANTTSRSKMKMKATNAAQNIMEDLSSLSVEETLRKYGHVTKPDDLKDLGIIADGMNKNPYTDDEGNTIVPEYADRAYRITIDGTDPTYDKDLNEALDAGYKAEIFLDPTFYSYSNGLNVSNFNLLSSDIAAIYSMPPTLDEKAYIEFLRRNEELYGESPDDGESHSALGANPLDAGRGLSETDYHGYRLNKLKNSNSLYREIRVDIEKSGGMIDNPEGDPFPEVQVSVQVSYWLRQSENVVDTDDTTYVVSSRRVFTNSESLKKLSSVFVMYYPLYGVSKSHGDIITVHNHDGVECDLYVVAQDIDANHEDFIEYLDKNKKGGLTLNIYEDEGKDSVTGEKKHPIRLRTNLIYYNLEQYGIDDDVEYSKKEGLTDDEHLKPIRCYLQTYKSSVGETLNHNYEYLDEDLWKKLKDNDEFADTKMTKKLNAGALDGKTLNAVEIDDRIYDVTVTVWKPSEGCEDMSYSEYMNAINDPANETATEWPVTVELTGSMLQKGE